jgi:hypothetical protein
MLSIIFLIPILAGIYPITRLSAQQVTNNYFNIPPVSFIPLSVVFLLWTYFFALGFYFLAKEGNVKGAIKKCFGLGLNKIGSLISPFLISFVLNVGLLLLLRKIGAMYSWGLIVFFLFVVLSSFFIRLYLRYSLD